MPKREVTYKANQVMARGEDKITEICTIIDGLVKCTDYSNNGEELHSSYFASGVTFQFYMLYGGEENYCFNTYAAKKNYSSVVSMGRTEKSSKVRYGSNGKYFNICIWIYMLQ